MTIPPFVYPPNLRVICFVSGRHVLEDHLVLIGCAYPIRVAFTTIPNVAFDQHSAQAQRKYLTRAPYHTVPLFAYFQPFVRDVPSWRLLQHSGSAAVLASSLLVSCFPFNNALRRHCLFRRSPTCRLHNFDAE